jgi:DNA-binding transcriptional LysR family regulator
MELRHLRYFVAVAEDMHFGRAAKRLHIVQPALSKQIAALERELGVMLISRDKHRIAFTPAGRAFFEEALDILRRVDHATRTAKMTESGAIGSLDIGFNGPAMLTVLPSLLREHHSRYPGVRFVLHERPSAMLVRNLKDGALDAGFVYPFPPDEMLNFVTVLREPFVVGLPESHPLAAESEVDLSDCADDTFVLVSRSGSPGFFDRCLALCQGYGFSPAVIEEGDSPAARYGMVSAGIGVTVVAASAVHAPFPGVVFRPLINPSTDVELAFAYRPNDDSAALAALMQTLEELVGPLEIPPVEARLHDEPGSDPAHARNGEAASAAAPDGAAAE